MDIVAHALWAGVGGLAAVRARPISRTQLTLAVVFAAVPDIAHLLPIVAWALFDHGSWSALRDYALATPGAEPWLPAAVWLWSHTAHCALHSALVAGAVSLLAAATWRWLLWPLAGWWSHIVIDVFTHSKDYYPSPVLYPITEAAFDGIAWPTPWFMVLNYAALLIVALWLRRTSRFRTGPGAAQKNHCA